MFPPNVLAPELVQCTFLQRHLSHSLDCLRFLTFFISIVLLLVCIASLRFHFRSLKISLMCIFF